MINIYYSTNENAELSNFAIRPFIINGVRYDSVEQYFQIMKFKIEAVYTYDKDSEEGRKSKEKIDSLIQKMQNTKSGSLLKKLGNTRIKNAKFNSGLWTQESQNVMREGIFESFKQNPPFLKKLLETGDATLTHNQDKSRWGKLFPKILMEVREQLKESQ
ncbi:hypothetical protein TVAG_227690 [Trichomonas vaginalis G3]|uniref:NADAR domain-containing protein n=1 Tax=Trichomonas vaginalis (strain ATCC PRA-98 / G3) TaxID=412133 RepID=A2ERS1_TRIV3|nr:conserved domain protein family [Trichomonas vaginalis G3]EAY04652.1 hypothetical protein TVAG_227690 [Trichomonas vaginalis G3]KAI5549426.1 conserved domain protein family [Trichomonas vaginalis G3]|eukprot:XP_001316875.1 hypothetical protein [Trichomonas vaginalis G3]